MFKKIVYRSEPPPNTLQTVRSVIEAFTVPANSLSDAELLRSTDPSLSVISAHHFQSYLQCKKKFVLERVTPVGELPMVSLGDVVRGDDGATMAEMTRRMHRMTCPTYQPVYVKAPGFEAAALETCDAIQKFCARITAKVVKGEPLDPIRDDFAIYRPALAFRPYGYGTGIELRCRPAVVAFSVRSWKWSVIDATSKTYDRNYEKEETMRFLANRSLFYTYVLLGMAQFVLANHAVPKLLFSPPPPVAVRGVGPAAVVSKQPFSTICDATSGVRAVNPYMAVTLSAADYDLSRLRKLTDLVPFSKLMCWTFDRTVLPPGTSVMETLQVADKYVREMVRFVETDVNAATPTNPLPIAHREKLSIEQVNFFKTAATSSKLPRTSCGRQCSLNGGCMFFTPGFCQGPTVEMPTVTGDNWVTNIPLLKTEQKYELWNAGYRTLSLLEPLRQKDGTTLNPAQGRFMRATLERKILVHPGMITEWLSNVRYPALFLDFECAQFAIPPFKDLRPYEAVPFQFSLHVFFKDILTEQPTTHSYLAMGTNVNPHEDPRAPLWKVLQQHILDARVEGAYRLIQQEAVQRAIDKKERGPGRPTTAESDAKIFNGSTSGARHKVDITKLRNQFVSTISKAESSKIFGNFADGCVVAHYAPYEKRVIQKLGWLDKESQALTGSLLFMDTMDLLKTAIVHPDAHGSNSMKKILPALCPHLSYADMFGEDVAVTGDSVAALYRQWSTEMGGKYLHAPPKSTELLAKEQETLALAQQKWDQLTKGFLAYCDLDVMGMWEVVRVVAKLGAAAKASGEVPDRDGWIAVSATVLADEPPVIEPFVPCQGVDSAETSDTEQQPIKREKEAKKDLGTSRGGSALTADDFDPSRVTSLEDVFRQLPAKKTGKGLSSAGSRSKDKRKLRPRKLEDELKVGCAPVITVDGFSFTVDAGLDDKEALQRPRVRKPVKETKQ